MVKEEVALPNQQPHANHHLLYFPLHVDVLQPPWVIQDMFMFIHPVTIRATLTVILTGKDGHSPPLLLVMLSTISEHK